MTLHLREGVKRRESKKKGGGLKEEERGGEDWERTERRQERKEEEGEERKGVWVRVDKRGGEKKKSIPAHLALVPVFFDLPE